MALLSSRYYGGFPQGIPCVGSTSQLKIQPYKFQTLLQTSMCLKIKIATIHSDSLSADQLVSVIAGMKNGMEWWNGKME